MTMLLQNDVNGRARAIAGLGARGEARPGYEPAFAAQLAVFTGKATSGMQSSVWGRLQLEAVLPRDLQRRVHDAIMILGGSLLPLLSSHGCCETRNVAHPMLKSVWTYSRRRNDG
jgi:hypothetical protein